MMRKNLRRAASLLVSLSLCASAFAGLTAHGYEAKISGWSSAISDEYSWLKKDNVTAEDQEATYAAVADELKYQNETLNFNIGTTNEGSTDFNLNDGWNNILHIQFENWVAPDDTQTTDNVGNPWNQTNGDGQVRKWGMLNVPFIGMAFTCKGQMSAAAPDCGQPILSNEFTIDDVTYQQMWGVIRVLQNGSVSITNMFPGRGEEGKDITNNTFRYAVAEYNQRNKRAGDGKGLFAGYAAANAAITADGKYIYQELTGPSGKAYLAISAAAVDTANLVGAQLIPADLVRAFDGLGDTMDARLAVTGAPTGAYADGKMAFEKGILTAGGFQSTICTIDGFSFAEDAAPAIIDQEAHTITAFVKDSANLASLTPTVTITGSGYTPAGAQDFTKPVTYKVTAAAGNTQEYTVKVVKLNNASISTFKIEDAEGVVDQENKTVTVVAHADIDLTSVTPEVTFVGEGSVMQPSANIDLSNSWNTPVKVTVTCGDDTAEYSIKARNMNTDNSITAFSVSKDKLRYATADIKAAIDNVARTITMVYPWGEFKVEGGVEIPYAKVPVNVTLPSGATISPDPTIARDQLGQEYVVTSEDGTQAVYTVQITLSDDHTFPQVDSLNLQAKNNWNRFGGAKQEAAEFAAILEEYNYQRSIGFDPGVVSGGVEGWGELLSRQFFIDGSGTHNCLGLGTAMIAADVCFGKAYTVKNKMFEAWERGGVADIDGFKHDAFDKSGCPTENEFLMDGTYYQQFSLSYGTYTSNGAVNRVTNGVGNSFSAVNNALRDEKSPFYDLDASQIKGNIRDTFRDAYEGANKSGINPGVAIDGPLQYDAEHHILYQVFTGTGEYHSQTRDSSQKTLIFKGLTPGEDENGDPIMTSNGSAIALLPRFQQVYENISLDGSEYYAGVKNEYETINLAGFTFKYSKTLGMPQSAPEIAEDGSVSMQFAHGFVTCAKDSDKVVWTDGAMKSGENRVDSIRVSGNATYEYHHLTDENKDDETAAKLKNCIRVHFAPGETVDLGNVKLEEVVPVDAANCTVEYNAKAFEPGTVIDLKFNATIRIVAENGSGRNYNIYAWQNGKALSEADPDYNTSGSTSSGSTDTSTSSASNPSNNLTSIPSNDNNNTGEIEYEYGYYDENGVWKPVTKAFYDKWSGTSGGNAKTGDAGVVGVVLLAAAAAGALVVLRKKK